MPRPRKAATDNRTERLAGLRLTFAERAFVEQQADLAGLPVAEFTRRRLLGQRVNPAPSKADARLLMELNRVGVNINQIARNLNADRPERIDVDAAFDELRAVLDRLALSHGS